MRQRPWISLFTLVLILAPSLAAGQVRAQRRGQGIPPQRLEMERRLQGRILQMVRNQLGLTEDQIQALQGVRQSFREDRAALGQAQAQLRYRLRDPSLREMEDADAMEILHEMIRIQEEELALYRREQEELLGVLTPVQLVFFYRIRDQIGQQVQQLRGRGGPGGPPGSSPGRTGGGF